MKIVVDSNIIFSALISGKEIYVDIFKINDVFIPAVEELMKLIRDQ